MSQPANGRQASDLENESGTIRAVAEPQEPLQNESNIFDKSSKTIFSTYSQIAQDEDNKMVERWQGDTQGILIFTGLFSASITPFLTGSVQDLRPNPQDSSATTFYLANIYQILENSTLPRASIPSSVARPPPFTPPRNAVWVNSLWFLSFVIALICALLATLVQQWARRYLRNTQPARCSLKKQARLRAFFIGGVDKMNVSMAVGLLSILLHISLILFLSGLVIYLHDIHHIVYRSVAWCLGISLVVYGFTTLMPVFMPESPYNTPLTALVVVIICMAIYGVCIVSFFVTSTAAVGCLFLLFVLSIPLGVLFILYVGFLRLCGNNSPRDHREVGPRSEITDGANSTVISLLRSRCEKQWVSFKQSILRRCCHGLDDITSTIYSRLMKSFWVKDAIENDNIFPLSKIDLGILVWSIDALGEDETLEKVIEAIPGFLNSQIVKDLDKDFLGHPKFINSLGRSMSRTLLSNSVSEADKTRRLKICMDVADKTCDSRDKCQILCELSCLRFDRVPQTTQTAQLLAQWCTSERGGVVRGFLAKGRQRIVASIFPHVQNRDNNWIAFAVEQFGLQESDLRDYINRDDDGASVLLVILLHVIRDRTINWDWGILSSLSQFDILKADPLLRNKFCALWNDVVKEARERRIHARQTSSLPALPSGASVPYPIDVLRQIRHLFIALHKDTDSAPTQFSASTHSGNILLCLLSSYPSCNLDGHLTQHWTGLPIPHVDPNDPFLRQSPSALETQPINIGGDSTSQHA